MLEILEKDSDFFELDEPRFERIAICESIQEAQKELKKYIEKFSDVNDYKIEHLMSNGYTNQEIMDNIDKTMNYPLPPFWKGDITMSDELKEFTKKAFKEYDINISDEQIQQMMFSESEVEEIAEMIEDYVKECF